jgi:5'-methylthioadenosine phosphorylase
VEAGVGIIGGTGFSDGLDLQDARETVVGTPYGAVHVLRGRLGGREAAFVARHGHGHTVPPHRVNYRGNIWALWHLGFRRVLATAACGSLRAEIPPGGLALCDQFLDFTRGRPGTFFDGDDGGVRHTDMTAPYCPELRAALGAAAGDLGLDLRPAATYVCTEGPRFETPAEIRAYALLGGDLVGMTGVPEVVLAREAGLCYATVAIATNYAAGLAGRPLSHDEVVAEMARATQAVQRLLGAAVARLGEAPCAACAAAPGPLRGGPGGPGLGSGP